MSAAVATFNPEEIRFCVVSMLEDMDLSVDSADIADALVRRLDIEFCPFDSFFRRDMLD